MERYQFFKEERAVLEGLAQPFAVYQFIDKRVVTLVLSDGFLELFDFPSREMACYEMDHDMYEGCHPDDVARVANAAIRFATEDEAYDIVYRTKTRTSRDYHIVHASGKHVYTETGVRLAHVWYIDEGLYSDSIEENESKLNKKLNNALHENSILKASKYDYLTGLPSMTYFFELAMSGIQAIRERGEDAVILFLDLSGMKFFNSSFGFAEGDKLLKSFAQVLARIFGNENCCHISGDHFAAFDKEEGLKDKLSRMFDECACLNGGESLPVRVGIYPTRLEDVPVSVACDRAKFACDAMKNTYESACNYYDKTSRDSAVLRQYILGNLDRAIKEKWIQVYYQPIVRAVTGKASDEEALARWIDPIKGTLSPADFIPFLEDAGLIYKLDLYVLEQVLEKIRFMEEAGLTIVPQSINLSRSDFMACDMVEEFRRRVDGAGVSRDKITVEITESVIGNSFDFMKEQVERFRTLGFQVWMDDFGSGYSSMDVLQSIKFDLIKFDMSFMRKLDEGENGKIILTELMKMATSLEVDTVCEGVETEEQVHFLQEIGCLKLQGYYYERPTPLSKILERYEKGIQVGYENPSEAAYYEAIGRVNLYDLTVIANEEENLFQNFFNTLPMAIIEVQGDVFRFVRSNRSYRKFLKRFYHYDLDSEDHKEYIEGSLKMSPTFMKNLKQCCNTGNRIFFDGRLRDGSISHCFIRRVGKNPVKGTTAAAIAILSISEPHEGTDYSSIARALAADYYYFYYVDLETDSFIEYRSPKGAEELAIERHGEDFFEAARRDAHTRIYEEDREAFLDCFTKEYVLRELDEQGVFTTTYRLIDSGEPFYVNMKITRMQKDKKHLIIGVSIIDFQMKQQEMAERIRREEAAYARIMALSGDYLTLYTVDPVSGHYLEFIATDEYETFGFAKRGEDFFKQGVIDGRKVVYEEDLPKYEERLKKETVLKEIEENGIYQQHYRLVINGQLRPVTLKIVPIKESDGMKLIAGVRAWKARKGED